MAFISFEPFICNTNIKIVVCCLLVGTPKSLRITSYDTNEITFTIDKINFAISTCLPQFWAEIGEIDLDDLWLQQDGVTCHTSGETT